MLSLLLSLGLLSCTSVLCEELHYLTWEEEPDPGPSLDTLYVPGTPGVAWTVEEIENTRERILQVMIFQNFQLLKYFILIETFPRAGHPP